MQLNAYLVRWEYKSTYSAVIIIMLEEVQRFSSYLKTFAYVLISKECSIYFSSL